MMIHVPRLVILQLVCRARCAYCAPQLRLPTYLRQQPIQNCGLAPVATEAWPRDLLAALTLQLLEHGSQLRSTQKCELAPSYRRSRLIAMEASPQEPLAAAPERETSGLTPVKLIVQVTVAAGAVATVVPRQLLQHVAYASLGVGIGYGSTKLIKVAASAETRARMASLVQKFSPRKRLRALLLKWDPSLADDQDKTVRLRDLGGPFRGRSNKRRFGPPPRPGSDDGPAS